MWLYILAGAALAFGFNMASFLLVQSTSSLTAAMLGNVKIVLIIVLSEVGAALLGRSRLNGFNVFGYTVTIMAGALYTAINLHERDQLRGAPQHLLAALQLVAGAARQVGRTVVTRLRGGTPANGGSGGVGGGGGAGGLAGRRVGGDSPIGR